MLNVPELVSRDVIVDVQVLTEIRLALPSHREQVAQRWIIRVCLTVPIHFKLAESGQRFLTSHHLAAIALVQSRQIRHLQRFLDLDVNRHHAVRVMLATDNIDRELPQVLRPVLRCLEGSEVCRQVVRIKLIEILAHVGRVK